MQLMLLRPLHIGLVYEIRYLLFPLGAITEREVETNPGRNYKAEGTSYLG
jgi:hypothetical protein